MGPMRLHSLLLPLAALTFAGSAAAQQPAHAQVSSIAANPGKPTELWTCNRDNDSVTVVDAAAGAALAQIPVGVRPRSLAFSADGSRVFVANQRGDIPTSVNFLAPFTGSEVRGSVSVIDVATRTVVKTLTQVGVEPYGIAVAPNGKYFAVSGFRSGTLMLFDAQSYARLAELQYLSNLNFISAPHTIADVDSNRDGVADLGDPRGFVIRSDSARIYVTHHRSPFVSVVDVTLGANGLPSALKVAAKIDTNTYPFDPIYNPTPVQVLKSQGLPRFLEDIALSPDGSLALVPHVLHNINHDVNFDFGPTLPGDFANRVYPALTAIDAQANSFAAVGDQSRRLHSELSDPLAPAEYVAFGEPTSSGLGLAVLGGEGQPVIGGAMTLVIDGLAPGQTAQIWIGRETLKPTTSGVQLCAPRFVFPVPPSGKVTVPIPALAKLEGLEICAQALFYSHKGVPESFSNGVRVVLGSQGVGTNKMGHRAGHPSRVAFNDAGDRALLLNRGSEDLFLYEVNGNEFTLRSVFPPRHGFVERKPLDTATPMGDLPLGMAVVSDAGTINDDALVYITNELTRTVSVLRVDFKTGTILPAQAQIPTLLQPDALNLSQRRGDEIFEDASRAQTTGAAHTVGEFNNSCGSCHFEGGDDANVWQRPSGPRSTMPSFQGTLMTGLVLWKGVRLNMGETGPMFHGENGGTGLLSNPEQKALLDFHEALPVPLNPNWDPATGDLRRLAKLGKDLFFGTNDTGLNPSLRHGGCAECHPATDNLTGDGRGFTADFLDPILSSGENLARYDPNCISLQSNIVAINIRDVNSGVNIDFDGDGQPDLDRNLDGYVDLETYAPMNTDKDDDFQRDDPNSYLCPLDPLDPNSPLKTFKRGMREFSIPTKLGVFASSPYFHDHSAYSLRMVIDPAAQASDPVYGSPAFGGQQPYPGLNKLFNEFHDCRGHEQFVQGASKVQLTLLSTNVQQDIEALLAFIESL